MFVEYPQWLEGWWIDRACRHYGVERLEDCVTLLRRRFKASATVSAQSEWCRDPFDEAAIRSSAPLHSNTDNFFGGWQV